MCSYLKIKILLMNLAVGFISFGQCPDDFTISEHDQIPRTYQANETIITSAENFTDVIYRASNSIELIQGFASDRSLSLEIGECDLHSDLGDQHNHFLFRTIQVYDFAVTGDATASLGYFTNIGVGGAILGTISGTNAAILTGWAISAGIGSIAGGIF